MTTVKRKIKPVKMTEDEYLFSTEANKKHLLAAFDYIDNGGELITIDLDKLKKLLPDQEQTKLYLKEVLLDFQRSQQSASV